MRYNPWSTPRMTEPDYGEDVLLTQEWTPEGTSVLMSLDEETCDREYFHCTNERNAKVAAAAHNAALAALRADHTQRMNSVQDFYSLQLAAERERSKELSEDCEHYSEKLAAERERGDAWKLGSKQPEQERTEPKTYVTVSSGALGKAKDLTNNQGGGDK